MPEPGSPSVRRRRLATELRRLREHAGYTGEQVARRLRWSPSKVSRIETSRSLIRLDDLRQLLDIYGVTEAHRSELIALARESPRTNWIDAEVTDPFPAGYAAYIFAEAEASAKWDWEPQVVPGLLQTEAYAREVMLGWHSMFRLPPADVVSRVSARIRRQQVLDREPPLQLRAVIDESVLHRRFGSADVMQEQLQHLVRSADLPNVEIRVLPLDGKHPIGTGAFSYMQFPQVEEVSLPDMVVVEQLVSNYYVEDIADTNQYRVTFEYLRDLALDSDASRDLIVAAGRQT
jgi:transcriptional regulator with XRE-family HTH domain